MDLAPRWVRSARMADATASWTIDPKNDVHSRLQSRQLRKFSAMSREHKKKPGDMARARAKHLRRQEIQNAITRVRTATEAELEEESVTLRLHHVDGVLCEWDLEPYHEGGMWDGHSYLLSLGHNRLLVGTVYDKDGLKVCSHRGVEYVHDNMVLAKAIPMNSAAVRWSQ